MAAIRKLHCGVEGSDERPVRAETDFTPVRGAVPSVALPHDGFEPILPDAALRTDVRFSGCGQKRDKIKSSFAKGL